MTVIKIAQEFSPRLVNRNPLQGTGKHTGIDFRDKYLKEADDESWWADPSRSITLSFENVDTLGPSWANEVFAYFTKYTKDKTEILKKFILKDISRVKQSTIETEIDAGYYRE